MGGTIWETDDRCRGCEGKKTERRNYENGPFAFEKYWEKKLDRLKSWGQRLLENRNTKGFENAARASCLCPLVTLYEMTLAIFVRFSLLYSLGIRTSTYEDF